MSRLLCSLELSNMYLWMCIYMCVGWGFGVSESDFRRGGTAGGYPTGSHAPHSGRGKSSIPMCGSGIGQGTYEIVYNGWVSDVYKG